MVCYYDQHTEDNQIYTTRYIVEINDDDYDDLPSLESIPEEVNPAEEEEEEIANDEVERQGELDEYYEQYINEYQFQRQEELYTRESILFPAPAQPRQVQSQHLSEILYRDILRQMIIGNENH
jgi:hypothetical protein